MKNKNTKAQPAAPQKNTVHYTEQYLLSPAHPVTVNLIGTGGTGSQVLSSLARTNSALIALGHPGFYVKAIDPDKVSTANMGRQLFSPAEVGEYKCTALVWRINRFFGTDWDAVPEKFSHNVRPANITISCVDSGPARKEVYEILKHHQNTVNTDWHAKRYYWMDFGNKTDRGQVVIGTLQAIKQPSDEENTTVASLPTINHYHPEIFLKSKKEQEPSCSLAEALGRQDLFINTNLANMGMDILWKMFRSARIEYHGLYLNQKSTIQVAPIPVKK